MLNQLYTEEGITTLLQHIRCFRQNYAGKAEWLEDKDLSRLEQGHRTFIEQLLQQHAPDGTALARLYLELSLPFDLLMGTLAHLKNQLIQTVGQTHNTDLLTLYRQVNQLIESAKQQAAHYWLEQATADPIPLRNAQLRNKTLIRLCLEWLDQINQALCNDLNGFPLLSARESPFTEALMYPESLLICLDSQVCDQIRESHRLLYQKAALLHTLILNGRYENAYLIYRDIRQMLGDLVNLLGTLYFESQVNRVHVFFNFLQALLYLPGERFFGILNVTGLERINRLHGIDAGDRCLAEVEQCLNEAVERHQSWLVITRGIAGDFYFIGYPADHARIAGLLTEIDACLDERLTRETLPTPVRLRTSAINLSPLQELTTETMHWLVRYLDQTARQQHRRILDDPEETRAALDWIVSQYRQSLDLQSKLDSEQVTIFVQPLVSLLDDSRSIQAFEVLGRIPEGEGYLSAGMFIEHLIETGLITRFDRQVLQAVVAQRDALRQLSRRLFINISPESLEDAAFLDALQSALDGPLADFEIVLELTEQVMFDNVDLLKRLHERYPLSFAIDDFGRGFSTLKTVIDLAMHGLLRYLKIDGSLTATLETHPPSIHIIRIIQQMAKELKLKTVAEFIETQRQADIARELAVDLGQGFLLGVPDQPVSWLGKLTYLQNRDEDPPLLFG